MRKQMMGWCFVIIPFFFTLGQGHNIQVKVDDMDVDSLIVGYHFGTQRLILDTLSFDETNTIHIQGDEPLPFGVYFIYSQSLYFEFLVKEQEFKLETSLNGGYKEMVIDGSPENELFKTFQLSMSDYQRRQRQLQDSASRSSGEDSVGLMKEVYNLANEGNAFRDSMIRTNDSTYFARFTRLMSNPSLPDMNEIEDEAERRKAQFKYYKDHYFDKMGNPAELMRTPVLHSYVMRYFNDLVFPSADSINYEIDQWMEKVIPDKESFRFWLVTFFNKYQDSNIMGMDGVTVHLAEKYYLSGLADWISEESLTEIEKEVRYLKPNLIGQPAPNFITEDTVGQPIPLVNIEGEFLVLFFYDPDCGHCKKKTPVLVDLYDEIRSLGGEVVAVCTTTDTARWKEFIRENNMNWVNLADPNYRSNFRADYNVRSTPQLYVLNKERKIVAKRLEVGEQLIKFINNYQEIQSESGE
jgi:peroxiredoxin